VILDGKCRLIDKLDPAIAVVEQAHVGLADVAGQTAALDRKAVIHAGDLDPAVGQALDRVVGAAVTLEHLGRLPADRERQELVAEADAEHRLACVEKLANDGDRIVAGRRWVAPPGSNLTFTILVRPAIEALEMLSIIAALAVGDGVRAVTGIDPVFKWPNDVQVDGRKLAGILIEAEFSGDQPSFALVGIGLNVNQESRAEPEIAGIAVSLRDLLGHEVEREAVLAAVLDSFERWYDRAPDATIVDTWSSRLVTLGQTISVSFAGQVETGLAESVTPVGALRLRRPDGSAVVLPAGEVTTRLPPESPVG